MVFFTICHPNELANAHILGDSILRFHPESQFIIGLIGHNKIDSKYEIVELTKIIKNFDELANKFDTSELKANLKPSFFKYLIDKKKSDNLVYFNSNVLIINSLDEIIKEFENAEILITPQLIQANIHPDEKQILNTGIFSSRFMGIKKGEESAKFLNWWEANCHKKGFRNPCKGLNEDQLWLEFVPSLFENYKILKFDWLNTSISQSPSKKLINQHKSLNSPIEYGIPIPKEKTLQKKLARPFRMIAEQIDVFFDKF